MSRSKKIFLFLGLPIIVFYSFLIFIFIVFTSFLLLIPCFISLSLLRKERIYLRLNKFALILLLVILFLYPNITYIPSQIHRRLDRSLLITPDDPDVQDLNSTDEFWEYLNEETVYNISEFNQLSDKKKLNIYCDFILDHIEYIYDHNNYGVHRHLATPEEVLNKGQDDCQGRSVVMCSFLIYLGYDAYVAEGPFHHWVNVYLDGHDSPIELYRLNWKQDPYYIYNHKESKFLQDFFSCLFSAYTATDFFFGYLYLNLIESGDIPIAGIGSLGLSFPGLIWVGIFLISLVLSTIAVFFIKFPERHSKKKYLKLIITGTSLLFLMFLGLYPIAIFLQPLCWVFCVSMLFLTFFIIDRS